MPIENLGCFFNQNAREGSKEDIFKFPSEVTAVLLEEQVVWENSVPGMLNSSDADLYSHELFRTPTKGSVPLLYNLYLHTKLCMSIRCTFCNFYIINYNTDMPSYWQGNNFWITIWNTRLYLITNFHKYKIFSWNKFLPNCWKLSCKDPILPFHWFPKHHATVDRHSHWAYN